jgi:phospholipid-binding lipoprotein MlaA
MNRSLYNVNRVLDDATLKPIAKGYRAVTPEPVRKGVSNFFINLSTPRSMINNFLQGKPQRGFSELGRFIVNTTVGIGGLIDIATASGFEDYREDFGQTAAVWGIPDGPYVVLPMLGPQTLRDAVFLPVDIALDPLYQYENSSVRDKLYVLRLIDLRYRLLAAERFLEDSKDPYVTLRESYLQNREYEVYDGEPPEDDDFYDEFLDEE